MRENRNRIGETGSLIARSGRVGSHGTMWKMSYFYYITHTYVHVCEGMYDTHTGHAYTYVHTFMNTVNIRIHSEL